MPETSDDRGTIPAKMKTPSASSSDISPSRSSITEETFCSPFISFITVLNLTCMFWLCITLSASDGWARNRSRRCTRITCWLRRERYWAASQAASTQPAITATPSPPPKPAQTPVASSGKTEISDNAVQNPDPAAAKSDIETGGSFSSADLAIIIKSKTVRLDQNISVIRDLLGAPKEFEEIESCAYTGMDKFFVYDGLEVSTLPINGDLICSIDIFKSIFKTDKNITVGSAIAQIEAAYGTDYTLENSVLIYWAGQKNNPKTAQLYFMLNRDNVVEAFGIYNGKSAG